MARPRGPWLDTLLFCLRPVLWLMDILAIAGAIVGQGLRPLTWRRPVRAEFVRFLDLAGVRALPAVFGAGLLAGVSLIAQALYWLEQLGEIDLIRTVLIVVVVREIGPLLVALLVLGRGGLLLMSDLGRMRRTGEYRALATQGIDPFLIVIVPRVLAISIGCFCLTMVFIVAAFASGYAAASVLGLAAVSPADFGAEALGSIGASGYLVLPLKTLLMGLAIGAVCSLTALEAEPGLLEGQSRLPRGFLRSVLAVFVVSGLISLLGL